MKTHVKALVVGGGAVGASIAYHLARAGWSDVMLLERDELTSGSTWHAAGLLPLFNMGYATSHIHDYSVKFYKTLEEETGLNAGFAVVGNLRMAQSDARMDEYRLYASTAETVGIPYEWLSPAQIKERWPLVRTEDLKGAIFPPHRRLHQSRRRHPGDGQGRATARRRNRAQVAGRRLRMDRAATGASPSPGWWKRAATLIPSEEQQVITAEHVVTATGNHAQRTARLLGLKIPAIPCGTPIHRDRARPRNCWRTARPSPNTPSCATPMPSGTCAKSAAAGSWVPMSGAPRPASSTTCRTVSAPISSRSTWSGSRRNT